MIEDNSFLLTDRELLGNIGPRSLQFGSEETDIPR